MVLKYGFRGFATVLYTRVDTWDGDRSTEYGTVHDGDFVFNPEEKKFIGSDVLDGEGINYIGTTGK